MWHNRRLPPAVKHTDATSATHRTVRAVRSHFMRKTACILPKVTEKPQPLLPELQWCHVQAPHSKSRCVPASCTLKPSTPFALRRCIAQGQASNST